MELGSAEGRPSLPLDRHCLLPWGGDGCLLAGLGSVAGEGLGPSNR